MCGIAGIFHFCEPQAQTELITRMTAGLNHRGPDGQGIFIRGRIALGHRRLAIIDLSPCAEQPLCNEDGTVWLTYNGEIYNYRELRGELEGYGHHFASQGDSEVIVHAYEQWGTDCLKRFNGMFAFGLWDENQRRLWLVRDRLGVKPLFYSLSKNRLLFGSEIKAILCDVQVSRTLDYEALSYFLALNYTPAPQTLFASIRQLLPGQQMLVDDKGHVQLSEYWDVVYKEGSYRSEASYHEESEALLEDAVRIRLVSDVPFGAFLSGGLDSSTVSYWMARHLKEPLQTFTVTFGEPSFDEGDYARSVAQTIGAQHHESVVTADAATLLPHLVRHAEEPTADSSMVALYYLARETRRHVKMVLSGDGADEILAGYETYQAYYAHRFLRRIPDWFRHHVLSSLVERLPVSDARVSFDFKLRRFLAAGDLSSEDAHATWRLIFNADARRQLLMPVNGAPGIEADAIDLYRSLFARSTARHPLNRMLYVDTRFYLPNDMLVKVDRMTMAHGLEAREPFLDYRLVEFAASLPPDLKLHRGRHKKYLLRSVMQDKLPQTVLQRKKQGFNVPNARWIKHGLRPFVMDHLSSSRLSNMGLFDETFVANLLQNHFSGRADNSHQIWCLLTLSLWWHQFIEGEAS